MNGLTRVRGLPLVTQLKPFGREFVAIPELAHPQNIIETTYDVRWETSLRAFRPELTQLGCGMIGVSRTDFSSRARRGVTIGRLVCWTTPLRIFFCVVLFVAPGAASLRVCAQTTDSKSAAAGSEVRVRDTAGTEISGKLTRMSNQELTLSTGAGARTLPLGNLAKLEFGTASQKSAGDFRLQLADGSQITASSITSDGQSLLAQSASELLSLPNSAIANVLIGELLPDQKKYWDENLSSKLEADQLLVRQSSGALTKIDGIIANITEEAVEFEFSGQTIPVPFARLAGIRFFQNDGQASQPVAGSLLDRFENLYVFSAIEVDGSEIQISLSSGPELKLPLSDIHVVNFALGNLQHLADLEPLRSKSESVFRFELPSVDPGSSLGIRRLDPIRLPGKTRGPGLEFLGDGSATYEVPEGFTQFSGTVQLAPRGSKFTRCEVTISLEGEVLWQTKLTQPRAPVAFDVAVKEKQRLELDCKSTSSLPTGNIVQWLTPVLTK